MGEASRKAKLAGGEFDLLSRRFAACGIDTSAPGFFDQPSFVEQERGDPSFLERYAEWVVRRPRSPDYEALVRTTLPLIASRMEARLEREGCIGTCLNAANALSRSMDRLGIWNAVFRGSLVIEDSGGNGFEPAYYASYDTIDSPDGITGHAWLCVPPFAVVDVTVRHQRRYPSDEPLFELVPRVVMAENPDLYSPRVVDCVAVGAINQFARQEGKRDPRLHHRLLPGLRTLAGFYPARSLKAGPVTIRYVPTGVTASDLPLEECGAIGVEGLMPRDLWEQEIRPAFEEASTAA